MKTDNKDGKETSLKKPYSDSITISKSEYVSLVAIAKAAKTERRATDANYKRPKKSERTVLELELDKLAVLERGSK